MREPEENRNGSLLDLDAVGGVLDIGTEIAAEGVLDAVGGFIGDAVGGILDGISIDI